MSLPRQETVLSAIAQRVEQLERFKDVAFLPDSLAAHHNAAIETLEYLAADFLPSGSGFDSGTTIDIPETLKRNKPGRVERVTFGTEFHHMNSVGFYDGWTQHVVTVRPCLLNGFTLSISGRNRNDIKDVIHESFDIALRQAIEPAADVPPGAHAVRYKAVRTD